MTNTPVAYETVYTLVMRLSRAERARLIAQIAATLVEEPETSPDRLQGQSLRGILAGFGRLRLHKISTRRGEISGDPCLV